MPITDKVIIGMITVLEDGQTQLRIDRVILDLDGITEVSRQFQRRVLVPGQDVTAFPPRVQAVCNAVWTPAVVAAYRAAHPVGVTT